MTYSPINYNDADAEMHYLKGLVKRHREERGRYLHLIRAQAVMIAELLEGTE